MDLATAIAIEISGMHDDVLDTCNPLEFIHMKSPIQGWDSTPSSWQNAVQYSLNSKGEFTVSNIRQTRLFHYVDKDFLTLPLIKKLEELVNGS